MVIVAPRSAKLVETRGARFTLLFGYVFVLLGFLTMLLLWKEDISYWKVALGYAFVGIGVGLAGTPASHSLTGSVPVTRAGMASGTADLQRDLGGAILQSIMGAFLTAGYAAAASVAIATSGKSVSDNVQSELTKSFSSASDAAKQYPANIQHEIVSAAKTSFLQGDEWAYLAGIIAVVLGAVIVFLFFPRYQAEKEMLAEYAAKDAKAAR
jgi:MFS family permease